MSTERVKLAIYDLSNGTAKFLSMQFLGPDYTIDAVPHTSVIVYDNEYFFGPETGVSVEVPSEFRSSRNMSPFEILEIGSTSTTRAEFGEWCRKQQNGAYNAESYDLFEHNCNNFSDDALRDGLKMTKGVPEWILNVPKRFLASPMGQMVRPMLQNMQITGGIPFTTQQEAGVDESESESASKLEANLEPKRAPNDKVSENTPKRKTSAEDSEEQQDRSAEPFAKKPKIVAGPTTKQGCNEKTPLLDSLLQSQGIAPPRDEHNNKAGQGISVPLDSKDAAVVKERLLTAAELIQKNDSEKNPKRNQQ